MAGIGKWWSLRIYIEQPQVGQAAQSRMKLSFDYLTWQKWPIDRCFWMIYLLKMVILQFATLNNQRVNDVK